MERIDLLIVKKGLADSRGKAQALIMAGEVMVEGKMVDKPGTRVSPEALVEIKKGLPYVSRGGLKLARALGVFRVSVQGRICLDAGASTGGFTDCLLQNGAEQVIAVDVGYGQLAWKLRQDPRVLVMEKTNVRYLTAEQLPTIPSLITVDLSFISLTKVITGLTGLLAPEGEIISLIKPQFEAGREQVGKKGVIRSREIHKEVLGRMITFGHKVGLACAGLTYSPVLGPEGNIEFLIHWRKAGSEEAKLDLEELVTEAWECLKSRR